MHEVFPTAVYGLCFLASAACALLLARGFRRSGARMLLWSSVCFLFLALNNLLLVIDLVILPDADLRVERVLLALAAVSILLFGFVWDLRDE